MERKSHMKFKVTLLRSITLIIFMVYAMFVFPVPVRGGTIEVIPEAGVPPEAKRLTEQAANATLWYFHNNYNLGLDKTMRFVLVPNKDAFFKALQREAGMTQAEAAKHAQFIGISYKNTIVLICGSVRQIRFHLHATCHELVHQFQGLVSGDRHGQVRWMTEGSAEVIAARVLETIKLDTIAHRRQEWMQILRKAPKKPMLTELTGYEVWSNAMAKYGGETAYTASALAVLTLAQQSGYEGLFLYFKNLKHNNPQKAFYNAFKIDLVDFEKRSEVR
jgi:hypothetical protein